MTPLISSSPYRTPRSPVTQPDGTQLMDVLAFQRKWIDASRQKERSAYVTHFNDLCELLGVEKPLDQDPTGDFGATFEAVGFAGGGLVEGFFDAEELAEDV